MEGSWLWLMCLLGIGGVFGCAWLIGGRASEGLRVRVAGAEQMAQEAGSGAAALRAERDELRIQRDENTAIIAKSREELGRLGAESEARLKSVEERDRRIMELEAEGKERSTSNAELREQLAALEAGSRAERQGAAEKLALLDELQARFRDAFAALSSDALRQNNQAFLELATTRMGEFHKGAAGDLEQRQRAIGELVAPIHQTLERVDTKLQEVERVRAEAYGSLTTQLRSVAETQQQLHSETSNLVRALRAPSVRGRWGEVQLRRVVELAGMSEHCDFTEQAVADSEEGRVRPDLVVHLPAGKHVVVDAKVPLDAYLRALEAPDETSRLALLQDHARQVRNHMSKLAAKSYWDQFAHTPDHVVMFIPGEVFFFSALQQDPELIEYGVRRNVFVAGPATLISLLRTVAYGWRQELIAQNAEAISRNGRELYERIATLGDHLRKLGGALNRSVEAYNQTIGSLETRVLVGARRFKELGAATGADLDPIPSVERTARQIKVDELQHGSGELLFQDTPQPDSDVA